MVSLAILHALGCTSAPPTAPTRADSADTGRPHTGLAGPTADTGAVCPPFHDVDVDSYIIGAGPGIGSALGFFSDDRLLAAALGNREPGPQGWQARVQIRDFSTPGFQDSFLTTQNIDGTYGNVLGQQAVVVGDTNGDGAEDVVLSVFDGPETADVATHSGVVLGPFEAESPGLGVWTVPGPQAYLIDTVAWDFAQCDVNGDGLMDLCSSRGVAMAPPPFDSSLLLPGATPQDVIAAGTVNGEAGLVAYRSLEAEISFLSFEDLGLSVTTWTALGAVSSRVLDLVTADVLQGDGIVELVGVVDDNGNLALVIWELGSPVQEVMRFSSPCRTAGTQGALTISDFNLDGQPDVAFASGGWVGAVEGPVDAASTPVWWHAEGLLHEPEAPFGFSLAASSNGSLLVGYPGRLEFSEQQLIGGAVYEIDGVLVPALN